MEKIEHGEQTTKCITVDALKQAGDLMRTEFQATKGCFTPSEITKPHTLPDLEIGEPIKHQGGVTENPYPDNAVPVADQQARKSSIQFDYKDGTSFQLGKTEQTLELPNHQRLQIDRTGGLSILDQSGDRVPVVRREDPDGSIMPMISQLTFANGVRMSDSGGIAVIGMGDGYRVFMDRHGFRAVDNAQGNRLSLQGEFEFRGYK